MSDAGEPRGTAGRPMLSVLTHADVGDVAAVVSRWFGGTKLGRGGLVRAYGGCLAEALASAPRTTRVRWRPLAIELPWADHEAARRVLAAHDVRVDEEAFGERVRLAVRVAEDRLEAVRDALGERLGGRVVLQARI